MTVTRIPLTTYQIKQGNPGHKYGSPANVVVRENGSSDCRVVARIPIDRIPDDAVITSAILEVYNRYGETGSVPIRVYPNTESWKSSVTWNSRPSIGSLIQTVTKTAPAGNSLWQWNLTAFAVARNKHGITFTTTDTDPVQLRGSNSSINKPVLVVTYTVPPSVPGSQKPDGGAVSVAQPILTYAGDDEMTDQRVQYSSDGTLAGLTYDSGWLPASVGRYDPTLDPGTGTGKTGTLPNPAAGSGTFWRVQTTGPNGDSGWSGWAEYTYEPLEDPVITNPPAVTDDGSPTLQWTVTDQVSWRAFFYNGTKTVDNTAWDEDAVTRDWVPGQSIKVPGGHGRMVLQVRDSVTPRVAAEGAPTYAEVEVEFDTALTGSGPVIDSLAVEWDEPVAVVTGVRSLGIPDEISLFRDDVQVPLWDDTGTPRKWLPGADAFTGTSFELRDYTADPRATHSWKVRTRVGGVTSAAGPTATVDTYTPSVWIVNPRTGEKIEVQGYGEEPVVEQTTEEGAILHVPVHGDLVVEPVRRRLMRTTRAGSIEGVLTNGDDAILQSWIEQDSGLKYRLVFGRVNWSVILGDYSPQETFYHKGTSFVTVLVSLNWWERLADY